MGKKVAEQGYNMTDGEKEAVNIIKQALQDMRGSLDIQHNEDVAELDNARDEIADCSDTVQTALTTGIVKTDGDAKDAASTTFGGCKTNEVDVCDHMSAECLAYE